METQRKTKGYLGHSTITRDDGLTYLDAIQAEFHDRPEIYSEFLVIMKQLKDDQISTSTVMQRVADLFKGHPSLIQGFNIFLPAGVTMDTSYGAQTGPSSAPSLRSTQARMDKLDEIYSIIRFAEKIKQRSRPEVYDEFLSILSDYYHRMHSVDQEDITRQLKALFIDDADLFAQLQFIMGTNSDPI